MLGSFAQAVTTATQQVANSSPVPLPPEAMWLAAGGIVGALVRAFLVTHQTTFGRETAFDCFLGFAIGVLWNVPMFGVWPLFELSPRASYFQHAVLMALIVVVGVELAKRALRQWAPAFLEQKLGAMIPKETSQS